MKIKLCVTQSLKLTLVTCVSPLTNKQYFFNYVCVRLCIILKCTCVCLSKTVWPSVESALCVHVCVCVCV